VSAAESNGPRRQESGPPRVGQTPRPGRGVLPVSVVAVTPPPTGGTAACGIVVVRSTIDRTQSCGRRGKRGRPTLSVPAVDERRRRPRHLAVGLADADVVGVRSGERLRVRERRCHAARSPRANASEFECRIEPRRRDLPAVPVDVAERGVERRVVVACTGPPLVLGADPEPPPRRERALRARRPRATGPCPPPRRRSACPRGRTRRSAPDRPAPGVRSPPPGTSGRGDRGSRRPSPRACG